MSLMFRAMYRLGFKPWDTGVSPPELQQLIEGTGARPAGKALDLGCGTGTNSIYMANHGWQVTGVDFVPRAIEIAKAKASESNSSPRFLVGDVTRLGELGVGNGFTLVLDLGCFHSIPDAHRDAYVRGVTAATAPGADMLVWGFYRPPSFLIKASLTEEDVKQRFSSSWDLLRAWGGQQPDRFQGRWYQLKRRPGS
jgi:SAM-dependent methyltransferase